MSLTPGTRLGPYEIVDLLGAGGMAEVYRARDPRLGRDVAVKVLDPVAAADPQRRRRFETEARAVAALSHPHILAIYDVGTDLTPYLVTELLEGHTLRAVLARGPLTAARTVQLGLQLVAGLAAAHLRGTVHRDVKPENLFVTQEGVLKILDFGLARNPTIADAAATHLDTAPHVVLGTLHYMAPEQLRGEIVDHRADIFACGAVLFEMMTGRRAFEAESPADTISAILTRAPASLIFDPAVPPALTATVRRCLESEVERRYQTIDDLGAALKAVAEARPAQTAVMPVVAEMALSILDSLVRRLNAGPDPGPIQRPASAPTGSFERI